MAVALARKFADLIPAGEQVGAVCSAAFSRDGSKLVVGTDDGAIRAWEVQTSELRQDWPGTAGMVPSVGLGPDGSLVGADHDGRVRHASDGTERVLESGSTVVHAVAFSSAGAMPAAGGTAGTVRVWDATTGALRHTPPNLTGTVRAAAFAPDDGVLAAGGDDGIVRWNLENGQRLPELADHALSVRSVAFAPDGASLAAVGGVRRGRRLYRCRP